MTQLLEQIAHEDTLPAEKGQEVRLDEYALGQIHIHARKLAKRLSLRREDAKDLRQDLTLRLLEDANNFDARKASWRTFVVQVLDLASRDILQQERTRREHPCWNPLSQADMETDEELDWEECLPGVRDDLKMVELQMDIETVIGRMPKDLQRICWEVLYHGSAAVAAESLGMSQSSVQRAVQRIRGYFVEAGIAPHWFRG